jgi:hypothetical protein
LCRKPAEFPRVTEGKFCRAMQEEIFDSKLLNARTRMF